MVRGNKYKCYYCGNKEKCTKDHFIPKSKKGTLLVYACTLCNFTKKDLYPYQWVYYISNHIAIKEEIKIRVKNSVASLFKYIKNNQLKY